MKDWYLLWILFLTIPFAGCNLPQDSPPQITSHGSVMEPLPAPVDPPTTTRPKHKQNAGPSDWYPPADVEHPWEAIVIHHSATPNGNAEIFDRWHREGNHWEGVGYDFVIGNGTDSADGAVEVTFRWRRQMVGAHCKTPNNWANQWAIGICLVGHFGTTQPTTAQMASLRKLVGFLQDRYHIPDEHVYGHQETPGAGVTDCPGHFFNIDAVR